MPEDVSESWSWSITKYGVLINFWTKHIIWLYPWDLVVTKREVLSCSGTWNSMIPQMELEFESLLHVGKYADNRLYHEAPFVYLKRNGDVQQAKAAFYVLKQTYKAKFFKKSRFGKESSKIFINVRFNKPIGDSGCQGCMFEMRAGENPFQALHRMNISEKF